VYELIRLIKNPDNTLETIEEASIVSVDMISSDEFCRLRQEFGCPITITVIYKP